MPFIEVDTLGASLKKYTIIYTVGVASGFGLGYKFFHKETPQFEPPQYQINIPYKK